MVKPKFILFTILAFSMIASVIIYQRGEAAIQDSAPRQQQQSQQLADARAEQQRLLGLLSSLTNLPTLDHADELAKLHAKAETLRQQTNELARQAGVHVSPPASHAAATVSKESPEYLEQWRKARGTKQEEAARLSLVMTEYASDHQNQYPSNFDQVDPYIAKRHLTFSGTNRFEIIYQGSTEPLKGIPAGSIAVIRDTQTWLTPDGKQARVYGLMGGGGTTIVSEDNFQSYEAEHVIAPPKSP